MLTVLASRRSFPSACHVTQVSDLFFGIGCVSEFMYEPLHTIAIGRRIYCHAAVVVLTHGTAGRSNARDGKACLIP